MIRHTAQIGGVEVLYWTATQPTILPDGTHIRLVTDGRAVEVQVLSTTVCIISDTGDQPRLEVIYQCAPIEEE
jgi:hypothetical protein